MRFSNILLEIGEVNFVVLCAASSMLYPKSYKEHRSDEGAAPRIIMFTNQRRWDQFTSFFHVVVYTQPSRSFKLPLKGIVLMKVFV